MLPLIVEHMQYPLDLDLELFLQLLLLGLRDLPLVLELLAEGLLLLLELSVLLGLLLQLLGRQLL
jgi:hypothetical protein